MLYTVTDGYNEGGKYMFSDDYLTPESFPEYWVSVYDPDDDQLIKELDNEVVEEVEEEWGAWLKDGEKPVSNAE